MYFQDLTPYEYSRNRIFAKTLNIGWLSREHAFPIGDTPEEFRQVLNLLSTSPINLCAGHHDCEFCGPLPRSSFEGNGEIRVPAADGDIVYMAPQLVAHYVEVHRYLPPAAFIEAVLNHKIPGVLTDELRFEWKDRFPVLDGKWTEWRLYVDDGDLVAVLPGDELSHALKVVERNYCAGRKVAVSRSYSDPGGEGVVVEPVRHEISCIPVDPDEIFDLSVDPREMMKRSAL